MNNFTENIAPFLDIFFAGISTFLAVFLVYVGVQKKFLYNLIIGLALFFFSLDFGVTFLENNSTTTIPFNFYLLAILALYIYSHFVTRNKITPFLMFNIVLQVGNFLMYLLFGNVSEITEQLIIIASSVINIYLLVATLINLKQYRAKIQDLYSDIQHKGLKSIFLIVYLFLFFNGIWLLDDSLSLMFPDSKLVSFFPILSYSFSYVSVLILGFFALKKQYTIAEIKKTESEIATLNNQSHSEPKPQNLDNVLFEKIKRFLTEEKAYLNPNLSLNDLSYQLNSKNKTVSQTINHFAETTFYNFINSYRVAHFKTLISENKNAEMSIDGLIEICGFKSKSTFYSHFKRVEGCTPTQFIKSHK